ncbi:hypothetical protein AHAS_Ahas11G0069000 [Arachis hypogaea]
MTDIVECVPLVMSWIYHSFPTFCPAGYDMLIFLLTSRLAGLGQQSRDHHRDRGLSLRCSLDALSSSGHRIKIPSYTDDT